MNRMIGIFRPSWLAFRAYSCAGALKVGNEGPGSSNWWSNSDADVDSRGCLFDDLYIVHTDGSFENIQGDETWVEAWQGNVNADGNGQRVVLLLLRHMMVRLMHLGVSDSTSTDGILH